MPMDHNASAGQ